MEKTKPLSRELDTREKAERPKQWNTLDTKNTKEFNEYPLGKKWKAFVLQN